MSSIIVRSARIAMPQGNIANLRVSVDRSLATAGGPAAGVVATAAVTAQGVSLILPQITLYTTWDAPDATTQQAQYTAELVDSLGRVLVRFDGLNPFQLRLANSETTWKEIQDWNEFYRQSKTLTPNDVPGQYDQEPLQIPGNNIFIGGQSNSATDTMGLYAGNADNPPGLRWNVATQLWEFSNNGTTWTSMGSGGGGGTPAGPSGSVQFNDGGSFGGSAGFTYNSVTNSLSLGTAATPGGFRLVGLTGNYWNLASQNPAGNRTLYLPDDVTPDTGNFLFVSTFGATVQTDWSTGLTWSNSTRTLSVTGAINGQLGTLLSNTSNQATAETIHALTNDNSETGFLSLTGSGFATDDLQVASQLYLKGFAGIDQMLFELVDTGAIFRWGINATERARLDNTTGLTLTSPGGANTSGLKFANLTSASPAGASTAYLGVDNSGNVVRAAAPGGGGGAPVDATYLTLTLNGTLTNERVFTLADTTLSEVDGGAGGSYTLGVNQANTFAWTAAHTWNTGTTPGNAISLTKASIGSAGQRDSDRFLIQAKANNGTDWAIETRNYINVVSNDGVGSLWTIDGRNTFAGAGFNTLLTLNISNGDLATPGTLVSGAASTATGALTLFNSAGATSTTLRAGNAASSLAYVLPATDPTLGQVMQATAPSGGISVLSWSDKSATSNGLYRLSGYNLDRGLKKWRAALSNAPQAAANVVVIGDSITCGTGATSYSLCYQQQLQTLLQNRFGAGSSFIGWYVSTSGTGTPDPAFVKTSGAWPDAAQGGLTGKAFSSSNPTDALTVSNVYGTAVEIYTVNNTNTTDSFTVQIDGGAAQTITQSTTGSLATAQVVRNVISMGTAGNHTVRINGPASGSLYVVGIAGRNGTSGVRFYPFGLTGSRSTDWVSTTDNRAQAIAAYAPNLFIIAVNTNDFTFQTSLTTFRANIESLIVAAQAVNSDVLMLVENPNGVGPGPIPQSDYRDVMLSLADQYDCALLDILARWESLAYQAAQGLSTDTVHPTQLGHSDYFRALLDAAITGDVSETANAAQVFSGAVRTTAYGFDNARLGTFAGTSTLILEDSGTQWSIDAAGGLRFVLNFSSVPASLDTSGNLTISGNITANGSSNTKFNTAGGSFGIGVSGTPTGLMVGTTVSVSAQSVNNVRLGLNAGTPSLMLETTSGGGSTWTFDNASGVLRFILNNATVHFAFNSSGNFGIGTSTFGTSAAKVLAIASGTAPTTYPADAVQLMSADYAAGDARLRVYSENGALPVIIGGNAVLAGRQVVAKTGNYTVLIGESNTAFTNSGAAGSVTFTVPGTGVVESYTYEFFRVANQPVVIQLPPGATIQVGASVTTPGGTVTLDAVGSRLRIVQVGASLWMGDLSGAATFA